LIVSLVYFSDLVNLIFERLTIGRWVFWSKPV